MRREEFDVTLEFDAKQEMRDGTRLSANIFRPAETRQKFPAIVTRSPYQSVAGFQKRLSDEAKFYAKRGYAYIIQDCRGKNDSDGEYHPFFDDPTDGFDTLKWCTKQEWSDGIVGTTGASYLAWNQWGTAALNPPGLRAMICTVALPDPVVNVPFQNGGLVLWMAEWLAGVEGRKNTDTTVYDYLQIFEHLPLSTIDQEFGRKSKIWKNWISHPSADEYWQKAFYQDKFERIDVPVLHISGWYDDDLVGTHLNYTQMRKRASSEKARKNQKLIIGPWPHHVNFTRQLGPIDFGETALIDLQGTKLAWFDFWLKGVQNGILNAPRVDFFVMGANRWKKTEDWPLSGAVGQKYFLHSNGGANTSFGNGSLSVESPESGENETDAYNYDPLNPCPNVFDSSIGPAEGPFDQRPIEMREDVLVYSTSPLGSDTEVTGPVQVVLYTSTSARDTDFWAQLTDVFPNGFSMHLTEGILRGRYCKSLEVPELLEPGKVYEFKIDLWITSNLFLRGHKIRLDVSSSSFPKYDRNPNTGHQFGKDAETAVANQRVFHSREFPSYVVLPIV
jgi:uncharacterized protein